MSAMRRATYGEWLTWMFGACLIAASIAIALPKTLVSIAPWTLIAGVALHIWGMVRIYRRNRDAQ